MALALTWKNMHTRDSKKKKKSDEPNDAHLFLHIFVERIWRLIQRMSWSVSIFAHDSVERVGLDSLHLGERIAAHALHSPTSTRAVHLWL